MQRQMRIEAPERAEFTYIFLQRPGELFHCFTKPNFLAQGTRHGFTLVVILRLNTTQMAVSESGNLE
jgi:hypothetical protein